ncbi:MFS transporter [Kitasatospora sp. NPDC088783]|uniref:MFS transporter n=1 Tax=Kitasatospora sp. NPDC088783 TaxID=3364077 RepID=UPI00382E9EAD
MNHQPPTTKTRTNHTGLTGVLCTPHVPRMILAALMGRLPTSVAPLAILVLATTSGASYTRAGCLAAAYGIACALGQPLLGRWADHRGMRAPLLGCAAVATTALTALPFLGVGLAATAAAILAGFATPPVEGVLRAQWPRTVDKDLLPSAYALDAASQSVVFVAGPLLLALTAQHAQPGLVLIATAVASAAAVTALATTPAALHHRTARRTGGSLGPLRSVRLRTLYVGLALLGGALGAQAVAATATTAHGSSGQAGFVLASFSAGSLIGGTATAAVTWRVPAAVRLRRLLAFGAAGWLPVATAAYTAPAAVAAAAFLPGLALAPALAAAFAVCADHAPSGTAAEAAGWLIAAIGLGSAAGGALAGPVVDTAGAPAGFALVALLTAAASLAAPSPSPLSPGPLRKDTASDLPPKRPGTHPVGLQRNDR